MSRAAARRLLYCRPEAAGARVGARTATGKADRPRRRQPETQTRAATQGAALWPQPAAACRRCLELVLFPPLKFPHGCRGTRHDGERGGSGPRPRRGREGKQPRVEAQSRTSSRPDAAPPPTKARRACARAGRPNRRSGLREPVALIDASRGAAARRCRPRTAATRSATRPSQGGGGCQASQATERTRRRRARAAKAQGQRRAARITRTGRLFCPSDRF